MAKIKSNMLTELVKIKDKSFQEVPFNDIDAFLFTMLSYMPFSLILDNNPLDNIIDKEVLSTHLESYVSVSLAKRKLNDIACLKMVLSSLRYQEVELGHYLKINDTKRELQFAAITFILPDFLFVSYCGTDATTLGWKEDLNFVLGDIMPCQIEGINYLNHIAETYPTKRIELGGHSKGGSIAVYAATQFINKNRIDRIYSMDGPGYFPSFYQQEDFLAIKNKIVKYSPESSIIGLLLTEEDNIHIISCYGKGIAQHDPYNWEVRNHDFVYQTKFNRNTYLLDQSINDCINMMTYEQRLVFVNTFYEVIKGMEIVEFRGMKYNIGMLAKAFTKFLPTWHKIPKEHRKLMMNTLNVFVICCINERKKRMIMEA